MPQSGWVPYHLVHYRTVAKRSKENTQDYGNFPQKIRLSSRCLRADGSLIISFITALLPKEAKKIPGIMEMFRRGFVSGGHISLAGDSLVGVNYGSRQTFI
ncbi:hypothetical protein CEXT_375861 [Caerostris extrusa]|uniref:Uncharacterized protein n=1 Tax=Caerostris extrusa TaxID=172846 RepID=A0AAV4VSD9_CAEEX|nr:hypothetical protein CEXT_375861 [Caerostris extrusa]